MKAEVLIREGRVDEALATLKESVRNDPSDWHLRVFLFQLLSVQGEWEGALNQLNIAADMNSDCLLLAQLYSPALNCEALRAEIFAGRRSPLFLGEPPEWVVGLTQGLRLLQEGQVPAAAALHDRAIEAAPATAGTLNGEPFEWIADSDSRLGPVLEAIIDGKYYWIPFKNIRDIRVEKPQDLRDVIWIKAYFTWANEGRSTGLIPVRYANSEKNSDDAVKLARKTEWLDQGSNLYAGQGQRMFATDTGEYSLLEIRQLTFDIVCPS